MTAPTPVSIPMNELPVVVRNPPAAAAVNDPRPQANQSWLGREVRRLPAHALWVAAAIVAVEGGIGVAKLKSPYTAVVGGFALLALIINVVAAIYIYKILPARDLERSAEDLQNQNNALNGEVSRLNDLLKANQEASTKVNTAVTDASGEVERLKATLTDKTKALSDVTAQLTQTKDSLVKLQGVVKDLRDGIDQVAKSVLNLNGSANEKLKQQVGAIEVIIHNMENFDANVSNDSKEINSENQQLGVELKSYDALMVELKKVVDILVPDQAAQQQTLKELQAMKDQNAKMKEEIAQLQNIQAELEKSKVDLTEYKKLVDNLNNPQIMAKLEVLLKGKDDPSAMAKYIQEHFKTADRISALTDALKLPDSADKLAKLVAFLQ